MVEENTERYEYDVPSNAIIFPTYEGTPEQVDALRATLRDLTRSGPSGGKRTSVPVILREAGLNTEGKPTYDQSALARFIEGSTRAPNFPVAQALYQKWVGRGMTKINLASVESVFYHAALIAMDVRQHSQTELARILCGHYYFYKRSALNPDFFVRGLLTIVAYHGVLHVSELQYHPGGKGMPETEEVDEGFAILKGNIIYIITRSKALKGATFTVINIHPVRATGRKEKSEEITTLFGFQIGGREFTSPTSSPFVAERISSDDAGKAKVNKGAESILGFIKIEEVPELLERHLRTAL